MITIVVEVLGKYTLALNILQISVEFILTNCNSKTYCDKCFGEIVAIPN